MRLLRVTWRLGAFAVGDSRSVGRRSSSIEAAGSKAWPFVYLVSSIRFRPLDQTMRLLRWFCVHDSPTGNRNGMASCRSSSIGWILDSIFSKQQASRPLGAKFLSHSFSAAASIRRLLLRNNTSSKGRKIRSRKKSFTHGSASSWIWPMQR